MMVLVGLEKGQVTVEAREKERMSFAPDDTAGIAEFLARNPGWPLLCSSSCNHPDEYGFSEDFSVHAVLAEARSMAYKKLAVRIEPTPLKAAPGHVEEMVKSYPHGFPLPVMFMGSGRDAKDVLMVFEDTDDLQSFLCGLRYGANLAALDSK